MSRTITYSDGHGSTGGFYTTIELDSGERLFVQIVKERDRVFVKVSKMSLGGLLPGKTLFEDSHERTFPRHNLPSRDEKVYLPPRRKRSPYFAHAPHRACLVQ